MTRADIPTDWIAPASLAEASVAQRAIAKACEQTDRLDPVTRIAGADVSMKWRDSYGPIHAALAPFAWPSRAVLPAATATALPRFPYVPGFLGFREVPALLDAWGALAEKPQLILVDGQGRAHPRRCGVATQLGVILDIPTIGVAKSLLCGQPDGDLGPNPGDCVPIIDRGEIVALALRTRHRATPVYVSTGHRVSLDTAADWVLQLAGGRRLPLAIRLAHDAANARRRIHDGLDEPTLF